ncbi:MAG: hypothetical protein JJU15_02635 [Pararhodobacter sp.]|nr:hypothetical protein [Pararhodobacter sp.]
MVSTVFAAGIEVAHEVLAKAQGTVLPLMPYFDTQRWVLNSPSLGGIALPAWARVDNVGYPSG